MRVMRWFAGSASVLTAAAGIGLVVAPSAPADCVNQGGSIICNGGGGGTGPGPFASGTCEMGMDWYCDDSYGLDVLFAPRFGDNSGPDDDAGSGSDRPRPTRPPRPQPHR